MIPHCKSMTLQPYLPGLGDLINHIWLFTGLRDAPSPFMSTCFLTDPIHFSAPLSLLTAGSQFYLSFFSFCNLPPTPAPAVGLPSSFLIPLPKITILTAYFSPISKLNTLQLLNMILKVLSTKHRARLSLTSKINLGIQCPLWKWVLQVWHQQKSLI